MNKNYWNKVERICERCNNCILNEYTLAKYKKIPNFLSENWMLFCRCNGRGISKREAEYLELQEGNPKSFHSGSRRRNA